MNTEYTHRFLNLIEEIAEDGELTYQEIYQLAKWLNDNQDGRKAWPANQFLPLLKSVFADRRIEPAEARQVAALIQNVRRQWAREHALEGLKPQASTLRQALAKFDDDQPRLPSIATIFGVAALGELNSVYEIDFSGPTCTCLEFNSERRDLPKGHLSRCCAHIMQGFSELKPTQGWPSWLDSFLEAGFRPQPNQQWSVIQCRGTKFLVSSANSDWASIYAKIDGQNVKYSYHISEHRWAYDSEPEDAEVLSQAIRKLSVA